MSFMVTTNDYVDYLVRAAKKIADSKEYISELDGITGDGDHWANMNLGFENILEKENDLRDKKICDVFKDIGMIMMTKIGGSSGILYGGAYIAAAGQIKDKVSITSEELCACLNAMVEDMCERGQSKPGYKTMIDALYPAAEAYKKALSEGMPNKQLLNVVKKAAKDGAESTAEMKAVRGRASYRTDKAVGHLDPGAVTMAYQLECLCDCLLDKVSEAE